MDIIKKGKVLNTILSGEIRIRVLNKVYIYKTNFETRKKAQYLYEDIVEENSYDLLSNEHLLLLLKRKGIWSESDDVTLSTTINTIDTTKVELFRSYNNLPKRKDVHKKLSILKNNLDELYKRKHSLDHQTVHGFAKAEKFSYIIQHSIYDEEGNKLKVEDRDFIELAFSEINKGTPDTSDIRYITRNEPWRVYHSIGQIFQEPPHYLEEFQVQAVSFGKMYDNVFSHHECPSIDIINDDDALDGWLRSLGTDVKKEKTVSDHKEIWRPVKTVEEFQDLDRHNSEFSRSVKQKRQDIIKNKGSVNDKELPGI